MSTPNTKARELAEKIDDHYMFRNKESKERERDVLFITSLLSEAMEEAVDNARTVGHDGCRKEAYLKAAEIAKSYKCGDIRCRTGLAIAAAIEQMAKENK